MNTPQCKRFGRLQRCGTRLAVAVLACTLPITPAFAGGARDGSSDEASQVTATVFSPAELSAVDRDIYAPMDFEGRFIVSISDADMLSSAYVNGMLGPREGRDALSVIPLGGDPREWQAYEVEASNSVAGPPAAVDITPDGRFAFVVESFTPRPADGDGLEHTFGDLAFGDSLLVFDLADPRNPVLHEEVRLPLRPDAVRVNATGTIVAVSINPNGGGTETPIAVFPFGDGRLGEPSFPSVPAWVAGDRLIDLDFHPETDVLALINETGKDLRFVEVLEAGGEFSLELIGNVVETERAQYRVEFAPDGRHVLTNALYWGADIQGTWNEAPRGSVISVRYRAEERADGTVRHALVSRAITGVSPEGLAISPDGRWVATTNLERSFLPYDDPRITFFSSITLIEFDRETGALRRIGDFTYSGILPEAVLFDNSGNYLAVATYDHFDDRRMGGSIDFWRIAGDVQDPFRVELVKTEYSVPVTRGAHSMAISR